MVIKGKSTDVFFPKLTRNNELRVGVSTAFLAHSLGIIGRIFIERCMNFAELFELQSCERKFKSESHCECVSALHSTFGRAEENLFFAEGLVARNTAEFTPSERNVRETLGRVIDYSHFACGAVPASSQSHATMKLALEAFSSKLRLVG